MDAPYVSTRIHNKHFIIILHLRRREEIVQTSCSSCVQPWFSPHDLCLRRQDWVYLLQMTSIPKQCRVCAQNRKLFFHSLVAQNWRLSCWQICFSWGLSPWRVDGLLMSVSSYGFHSVCLFTLASQDSGDTETWVPPVSPQLPPVVIYTWCECILPRFACRKQCGSVGW